jgi:hypothetical protein
MNDDWSMFISVTILMFLMICLCLYLQNAAIVEKEWSNLKCNPLYMFVKSITDDNETSINNFKSCVVNVA